MQPDAEPAPSHRVAGGWAAQALLPLAVAVAAAPVLVHAVGTWWSDSELSFGFLVLPVAAGLVWVRRPVPSPSAAGSGSWTGLLPLTLGLAVLVVGDRVGIHALAALGVLPAGLGLAWLLGGGRWARTLSLPLTLATFALMLYRGMLSPLGFAMQEVTAASAARLAAVTGVPVRQAGVDLFTPHVHLVVAQACSGMDSLLALLSLGVAVAGLAAAAVWRRTLLFLFILPVILAANVVRVTLVLLLSGPLGAGVEQGVGHAMLSGVLFCASTLLLLGLAHLLQCPPRLRRPANHLSPAC